jgi:hypothetical protein
MLILMFAMIYVLQLIIFSWSRKRFVYFCIKIEKKFNTTRLNRWSEEMYMDARTLPSETILIFLEVKIHRYDL